MLPSILCIPTVYFAGRSDQRPGLPATGPRVVGLVSSRVLRATNVIGDLVHTLLVYFVNEVRETLDEIIKVDHALSYRRVLSATRPLLLNFTISTFHLGDSS